MAAADGSRTERLFGAMRGCLPNRRTERRFDPSRIASQSPYPHDRTDLRSLDPDYDGFIYTWDIDKTYLDTEFHSARDLVRTAFEFAVDKRAIAGTVPLLRGLRRGVEGLAGAVPIYFVSASPPQLRGVIERKMLLDGVEHDGITLKDQFALARRGRFKQMREHVGYKLSALLLNRRFHPRKAHEVLFGDDSEADALVYSLYARAVSGRLRGAALESELERAGVGEEGRAYLRALTDDLEPRDAVRGAFIHLATGRTIESIEQVGEGVRASHSPLQAALALWEWKHVDDRTVRAVVRQVAARPRKDGLSPLDQVEDARARGIVSVDTAERWATDSSMP